jgi:hypothetical protein
LTRLLLACLLAAAAIGLTACGSSDRGALRQQESWGDGVFALGCARCHGNRRTPGPLESRQLVSSFPYAAALQQFVRVKMPYDRPGLLTASDAWAVTAFLLARERLLPLRSDHLLGPYTARGIRLGGDVPRTGATAP